MRARSDLIEAFSSFLQFEADRASGWVNDRRLQKSMQRCCEQTVVKTEPEKYWALHWHKCWQTEQNAQGDSTSGTGAKRQRSQAHLLAYLQEPCYWVAYKSSTRFTSTQHGISDCFQIAIAQLEKVLKGFNSQQGFDLKNYASTTFRSFIRDYLRQRREVDICTDWSLLRKVSQKRLSAALAQQGLTEQEIAPYVLAWQIYQLIYVPTKRTGSRQLTAPDEATWQAIAQQYNRDRHSLNNTGTVTAQTVETWLSAAAKAVRSFLYPKSVSINATRPGQDGGEFVDSLTDDEQASPMGELMAEEAHTRRAQQQVQLTDVLAGAIAQMDAENQRLLQLYYGDTLTQKDIAAQLNIKQYSISRKLSRIKKSLLQTLSQWSQETLHIAPSPDLLNQSSAALEAWLTSRYAS
ncbi:MAG: sigma-70 family RNA polymerase sigma factor [Cyanobacteria bacterium P01_D01_bin.105]